MDPPNVNEQFRQTAVIPLFWITAICNAITIFSGIIFVLVALFGLMTAEIGNPLFGLASLTSFIGFVCAIIFLISNRKSVMPNRSFPMIALTWVMLGIDLAIPAVLVAYLVFVFIIILMELAN